MRFHLALALLLTLQIVGAHAQQPEPPIAGAGRDTFDDQTHIERLRQQPLNWFGSLHFAYSRPRGNFARFLDSINNGWGLGFGFNGGFKLSDAPVAIGATVDVLFFGSQERTYQTPFVIGGIPRTVYDTVNTTIMFVPITVIARIAPDIGWVQPYVEAGAGLTVISSDYTLKSNVAGEQSSSRSHVPFQYSVGAGLNVKVAEVFNIPVSRQAYYVNFGIRYVYGDWSDYTFWKLSDDNSRTITLVTGASRTDLYIITLGFQAAF
jgi:opacity protein-like surface antigen